MSRRPRALLRVYGASTAPSTPYPIFDSSDLLSEIAAAVAEQEIWRGVPDAVIVLRRPPGSALGVLGSLEAADEARIEALFRQVDDALAHLRYVSYRQAEEACADLAERLISEFGRRDLERFSFAAVPRGGYIVLGMLASILQLRADQLDSSQPAARPTVLVDDCALTGNRFGRWLSQSPSDEVVFAHLYSHPDLRGAIEQREERVIACLAARDLKDWAPDLHQERYTAWRADWTQRAAGPRYWLGIPDYLCFAWKEPDRPFWNPVTERMEACWRLIPAQHCLSNRSDGSAIPVQVQPEAPGPIRPPAAAIYGRIPAGLVVGSGETGHAIRLDGVAAEMWDAIVSFGNVDQAAGALSESYDVDPLELRSDLVAFLGTLRRRGLLEFDDAALRSA